MEKGKRIILGIDPGTVIMGYAVIEIDGGNIVVKILDVIKPGTTKDIYQRLEMIFTKVCSLADEYKPNSFAIEAPFFGKNVQSMLKLGRAQGVAIAAAMNYGINVTEYSPKKIKQAVTGNGNASKEQVFKMLQTILKITEAPKHFDATDALAVALCHHYETSNTRLQKSKGFKGWEDFVVKNKERVGKRS
jgi:crossover junction endodeoxyribonuclease RuvC